jgi:putative tryptophan/tyrosine transport system substrate-binding protein
LKTGVVLNLTAEGYVRRRDSIKAIAGSTAVWPLAARAQQTDRMRRIDVLMSVPENDPEAQAWLGAFSEGLRQLGWTAGRELSLGGAVRCGVATTSG